MLRKKSTFCVALHPSSLQRTVSTPHSSGFARLEFGAFYFAIELRLFTRSSFLNGKMDNLMALIQVPTPGNGLRCR
jgi:hypothetical protein